MEDQLLDSIRSGDDHRLGRDGNQLFRGQLPYRKWDGSRGIAFECSRRSGKSYLLVVRVDGPITENTLYVPWGRTFVNNYSGFMGSSRSRNHARQVVCSTITDLWGTGLRARMLAGPLKMVFAPVLRPRLRTDA